MDAMKGLITGIFKHEGRSCDGGRGISSKVDNVTVLPNSFFPDIPEIFECDDKSPPVVIVKRKLFGGQEPYLTAYPVVNGEVDTNCMFGGTYINTSDSRFPAQYPIPLHDRKE